MPPHIVPGLTDAAASRICMTECKAMCCRGPLILELTAAETPAFAGNAAVMAVTLELGLREDGSGWIRFSDYAGERCPMLDPVTFACRIYERRPKRCREFPEKKTPGCPISGG